MSRDAGARLASPVPVSDAARIVVRLPNWLGDVVMSTPGLGALREAAPRAEIVLLAPPPLVPLVEGAGLADAIWPLASRTAGLAGWRRDLARLRASRFDLGLVIPESISSALLLRAGGVRHVVGFARDPLRRALLHRALPAPPEWGRRRLVAREHFVLALMDAVGAGSDRDALRLATTGAEAQRLGRALESAGTTLAALEARPPVVLAPGASYGSAKCWPAERYAALADRLAQAGHDVVVVGAPGESERVAAVRRAMAAPAVVLDGVLDVGALKALLARARALVANDAGARHIAVGFGVPSVVFFGPTAVEKTSANLDRVHVLERDVGCRPCYRRTCPIDHRCLAAIGVDEAWGALRTQGVQAPDAGSARAPEARQAGAKRARSSWT